MGCSIDKNQLRSLMKQERTAQPVQDRLFKSLRICEEFLKLEEFSRARMVCVYISAFGEVDTSLIINSCTSMGKTVAVPVTNGDDIYLCRYDSLLEKGQFGILQPVCKHSISVEDVDIFAVPGLAFDRRGGRVGFGKGYYDKLLAGASGVAVGLLYDFQLVENIPDDKYDVFMDYLITESQVLDCGHNV